MPMNKKSFQPIIYALLVAFGLLLGRYMGQDAFPRRADSNKINHVLKLVQSQYVDSVDGIELQEKVIQGVLSTLDPHSYYIKADDVEQFNRELVGSFVGIGIEFNVINDTPYIVRVMSGGPAEKAGIRSADKIIASDTHDLVGLSNSEIVKLLKGSKNSTVVLHIKRPQSNDLQDFKVNRNTVPIPSVNAYLMLDSVTGYIRVDRFSGTTSKEFKTALKALRNQGNLKQVVIDLRNNGGGYLHTAIDMLDQFFDERKLLAYTTGKASYKKDYYSSKGGLATDLKLICLVNRNSASASEIFSGAIQDYDRGLIIGEKTFGKGLVQETFELPDLSQLRLTVSRYHIPSGRCIQRSYIDGVQNYYEAVKDRKDTLLGETDTFYFETSGGRKVFGGGGIDPDIKLNGVTKHGAWLGDESFNQTLLDFIESEYQQIIEYKTGHQLLDNPSMVQKVEKIIDRDSGQNANHILLPVIRRFYGEQSYFEEYTKRDSLIQKSLEYFSQSDSYLKH
jgi:carboxyl-terminal processing protease